jgi:hypothetical protein
MYIQKSIELKGVTGKTYTLDMYPKSAQLPDVGGIYILMYCHPRGHLAGIKVNTLHIGTSDNLNSKVDSFRQDKTMLEMAWNYTGIIVSEEKDIRLEYFTDLTHTTPVFP